ncbi:MAG: bifunctional tetrahydrofolate synthase/dihydrofolate synthase, partial [Cellvibrionaceae bacterium]|nr:bifunctional tetrahydrofolate synthase/dihydrofolate synthase [Cellvibrionaceae bacterium]
MSRDALTQLNLEQWLAQIEALHPTEIELGLERVRLVAERLELPQLLSGSLVITIAGTNGKGSCVASLEALLAQHPRKPTVGAFTSPHFLDYNERIRIGGQAVTDAEICAAFAAIEVARGEISLSYFEFGTLA